MSVQGEINRIKDAVSDAYSAVSDKGGEMPSIQNVDNLAQAVSSIPTGSDNIFIAEYGVTTYQEIDDAYNNGKTLLAFDDGRTYFFAGKGTRTMAHIIFTYYRFYTIWTASQGKYIECYIADYLPDSWDSGYFDFGNEQKAVFIAHYGVTTYQDVLNAYNAGAVCFCIKNSDSRFATLCQVDSTSFRFAALSGNSTIYNFTLRNDDSWLSTSSSYEYSSSKTQTISSSSTTSQYPSAKAVYDYIQSLDAREVSY